MSAYFIAFPEGHFVFYYNIQTIIIKGFYLLLVLLVMLPEVFLKKDHIFNKVVCILTISVLPLMLFWTSASASWKPQVVDLPN